MAPCLCLCLQLTNEFVMKRVLTIVTLLILSVFFAAAQQNPVKDEGKKKTGLGKPSGNPGDPKNAAKGRQDAANNNEAQPSGSQQVETQLGDDNNKKSPRRANSANDYRNNRVSGNPNNRSSDEGSNRRSVSGETDESSTSEVNETDSTGTDSSIQGSTSQGTPSVSQESTSGSGSPALLSGSDGEDRDGTGNVQRAKPNMAGSPVGDLRMDKKKHVDSDREIRKGTGQQQRQNAPGQIRKRQNQSNSSATYGNEKDSESTAPIGPPSEQQIQEENDKLTKTETVTPEKNDRKSKKQARKEKRKRDN
jgi:hypothetical protein